MNRKAMYPIDPIFIKRWSLRAMFGESITHIELMNLVAHDMEEFNYEQAHTSLHISANYIIKAMITIGKPAIKGALPPDLQEREFPSKKKLSEEIIFEGLL